MAEGPPRKRVALDHSQALSLLPTAPAPPAPFLEAPTLRLEGAHASLVLSCAFSPSGALLASASRDRSVALWSLGASCAHACSLRGHKGAVLRVAWLPEGGGPPLLATASADATCAVWDAEAGALVRTLKGHARIVNDVCSARRGGAPLLASASDDGALREWRQQRARPAASSLHHPHPRTPARARARPLIFTHAHTHTRTPPSYARSAVGCAVAPRGGGGGGARRAPVAELRHGRGGVAGAVRGH